MKGYDIPTDQYDNYVRSVHGIALFEKHDLSAPACNDCHGNHAATPPGVESIAKVCGACHALNAELFSASPHKKAFDELQLPECETCHGNHDIPAPTGSMVGVDGDAVCSRCHSLEERPKGLQVAGVMRTMIDSLDRSEEEARLLVDDAEQKGMEIGGAKFKLRDVHQSRLETRTAVHAFDEAKFREVSAKGLATAGVVREEAEQAIEEFYFRRIGLGVSTLIITMLAISLYLFIRRLERMQQLKKTVSQ
jgi:predicted CXXCH cytochrome family protein